MVNALETIRDLKTGESIDINVGGPQTISLKNTGNGTAHYNIHGNIAIPNTPLAPGQSAEHRINGPCTVTNATGTGTASTIRVEYAS